MIILLLGIVSIYTIKTMDEIHQDFNYHVDYGQKISNFDNIKSNYQKQLFIFELLKFEQDYNDVDKFWIYNTEIKNNILNFNNLIVHNLKTSEFLTDEQYLKLEHDVMAYHNLHLIYENSASNAFIYYHSDNQSDFLSEYDNLKSLHMQLIDKINDIEQTLQIIPISSKLSIEYIISDFQTSQWIMIILVGIVTVMLVFFLNKTNMNLKSEIHSHTENLHKLNKKLQKIDQKRTEFISIASHELKGPLQPIFGFVELAKTGIIPKQEALDGISNVAFTLENVANNVLDLTKIEHDELELNLDQYSINAIIKEVSDSEYFNPNRNVPIKTRLDVDVVLNLDKTRIKQVFRNILDNCIKFTKSGEIIIQTNLFKNKKVLQIIFTDTGPAIPDDILSTIFKKFITDSNGQISGFGLGLYISKKIIDAHNGTISAYNDNGYPVFKITIPIVPFDHNWKDSNFSNLENALNNN